MLMLYERTTPKEKEEMSQYISEILLKDNDAPANLNETSPLLIPSSTENTMSDNMDGILIEAVENYERGQGLQRSVTFAHAFKCYD